jgi:hypothetical protein
MQTAGAAALHAHLWVHTQGHDRIGSTATMQQQLLVLAWQMVHLLHL